MSAKGFMPGLFDRLIDRPGQAQTGTVPRVSLEDMKDSVARDLEAAFQEIVGRRSRQAASLKDLLSRVI